MDALHDAWGSYGAKPAFDAQERGDRNRPIHMRQPSVYATRLAKQPTLIARSSELEHLRAAYHHSPTSACRQLRCGTCNDLAEVERLLNLGAPVALHPIYPIAEGSRAREAK